MSCSSEPTILHSSEDFDYTVRKLMPKTVLYVTSKKEGICGNTILPAVPGITKFHIATHCQLMQKCLEWWKHWLNYVGDEASEKDSEMEIS
jgi:hypothetical protein